MTIFFVLVDGFPNRLREQRKKAGLTQEVLGERLGLTHTHISNMERRKRRITLDVMERMAIELGCAVSDLLAHHHFPDRLNPQEQALITDIRRLDAADRRRIADIVRVFAEPKNP